MKLWAAIVLFALAWTAVPVLAADANAGKNVFRVQCALCHSAEPADNGGAQGPGLEGLLGRKAASNSSYSYTDALRSSNLTWDAATLDRFLLSPTTVVPGSSMVVAVPNKDERENIVAYFAALKDGTFREAPPVTRGPPPASATANAGPPKGEADWKNDRPGRVHRIDIANLNAPFDTPTVRNAPRLIEKPANAALSVPPGFSVNTFATGLRGPRTMRLAPNGDIFVAEMQTGRISVLRPSADGSTAATTSLFAQGMTQPFGLQFYPENSPQWLYVAENNRVVRYAYKVGDIVARGVPEIVVPRLAPTTSGHATRDLVFSPDGKRMFVSVGSQSNVAEDLPKKSADEIAAWERQHGVGAAWGNEENRATVLVFDVGANNTAGKIFATGLRNCVGLTVQPATGDLWCTTNERDHIGDDLVPDYSTRVKEGGFYGWPWYYLGKYEDPRHAGARPDLPGKAIVPDVPFQAHSAALSLVFYPTNLSASSAFPREYAGEGFAVFHGSWNRAFRTGHKVVRVKMKNGIPTGEYEDFLVGFIVNEGDVWGRPAAAVVAMDGSLLVSDDAANTIYRVSYR